jgi:hypothetical protein
MTNRAAPLEENTSAANIDLTTFCPCSALTADWPARQERPEPDSQMRGQRSRTVLLALALLLGVAGASSLGRGADAHLTWTDTESSEGTLGPTVHVAPWTQRLVVPAGTGPWLADQRTRAPQSNVPLRRGPVAAPTESAPAVMLEGTQRPSGAPHAPGLLGLVGRPANAPPRA